MTHHVTTLDLPAGGANITTAAGDVAEFFATGTNTVQCVSYTRADGTAVVAPTPVSHMWKFLSKETASSDSTIDFFSLATGTYAKFRIEFHDVYPSADAAIQVQIREAGGPTVLTTAIYNGFTVGGRPNTSANAVLSAPILDANSAQITEDTVNGAANTRQHGFIELSGFGVTSTRSAFWGMITGASADTTAMGNSFYFNLNSEDSDGYDGLRFLLSTGSYTAGVFSLYGLVEA